MTFFKPVTMDVSFLKMGAYGTTGSGKTTSAALIAIGLHRHIKSTKPVIFYDTELARGWTHGLFEMAGVELVGPPATRSFKDLVRTLVEAPKAGDILLIDSITHPWRELMSSWKIASGRSFISIRDWGTLKDKWNEGFSIPFVNSKIHIIWCGRSANVYEDVEEVRGDKTTMKSVKAGTKASTEADAGYEPNLLIEMRKELTHDGGSFTHEANVIKDRSYLLDGKTAQWDMPRNKQGEALVEKLIKENAPFEFIRPHVEKLNLESAAAGKITDSSSAGMFDDSGRTKAEKKRQQRDLDLDQIEEELKKFYPGMDAMSKKRKADILEGVTTAMRVGTRSWRTISETFDAEKVRSLLATVRDLHTHAPDDLSDALEQGKSSDGKQVTDPQAAHAAVAKLAEKLWAGKFDPPVKSEGPDGLPF